MSGTHLLRTGIIALALLTSMPAVAQLEITTWTVDGGGGSSFGGGFQVSGTLGQPDAAQLLAGALELEAGFWTSLNPAVPVELMSFEVVSNRPSPTLSPGLLRDNQKGRRREIKTSPSARNEIASCRAQSDEESQQASEARSFSR